MGICQFAVLPRDVGADDGGGVGVEPVKEFDELGVCRQARGVDGTFETPDGGNVFDGAPVVEFFRGALVFGLLAGELFEILRQLFCSDVVAVIISEGGVKVPMAV